jgi:hypothetical protein
MADTENLVASDDWATLKRVLPHDIYDEMKRFESLVAKEIQASEVGLGASILIWSIIVHFLREHEAALVQCAKEWKAEER